MRSCTTTAVSALSADTFFSAYPNNTGTHDNTGASTTAPATTATTTTVSAPTPSTIQ